MQPASRYGTAEGDDDYGLEDQEVSQRSPKMGDKKSPGLPRRKSSFADNQSPTNCLNPKSAISFVTSAIG